MADISLFEQGDLLNRPMECYEFSANEKNFPIKAHWHYYMEIIFILSGKMNIKIDDKSFVAGKGDMVMFYPESIHACAATEDNNEKVEMLGLKFDLNFMKLTPDYAPKLRSIFKSGKKNGMNCYFNKEFTIEHNIEIIMRDCIAETFGGKYGSNLIQMINISHILISILRSWQTDGFIIDNETYLADSGYDIFTITEYIDEHLNQGLKVEEIAAMCSMSYSCFAKKFKNIYGNSCKEYIEKMRIYKVEEFLRYTDFDLNYISQETGFSDCSHMIKCFRKAKSLTPGQFRMKFGPRYSDK